MISKLAVQTYEKWVSEGLNPTFQDIVDLNAVGVQLERFSDGASFASVGRTAFIGDFVFHEPTVGQRLYLDEAFVLIGDDFKQKIFLYLYVMYTPFDELCTLKNKKEFSCTIAQFVIDVLKDATESQMLFVVDYLLNGNDGLAGNYESSTDTKDMIEIPESCLSYTRQILNEAIANGLDVASCREITLPALERVVALASIKSGTQVLKDETAQRTARFYVVAGKIHKRLVEDKNKKTKEEEEKKKD